MIKIIMSKFSSRSPPDVKMLGSKNAVEWKSTAAPR